MNNYFFLFIILQMLPFSIISSSKSERNDILRTLAIHNEIAHQLRLEEIEREQMKPHDLYLGGLTLEDRNQRQDQIEKYILKLQEKVKYGQELEITSFRTQSGFLYGVIWKITHQDKNSKSAQNC